MASRIRAPPFDASPAGFASYAGLLLWLASDAFSVPGSAPSVLEGAAVSPEDPPPGSLGPPFLWGRLRFP